MRDAGLAVELLETRHVRDAFKAMPVKTDRKDARDRPADALGLVPSRALQVGVGPGDPRSADGAQAAADEAHRRGDEPARGAARLRSEGRTDHAAELRRADPRPGGGAPGPDRGGRSAAGRPRGAGDAAARPREAPARPSAGGRPGT